MFERVIMPQGKDYKFGPLAYGAHQKIIKYVGSNKKVLDVGCADGYLGKEFKNNGCFVVMMMKSFVFSDSTYSGCFFMFANKDFLFDSSPNRNPAEMRYMFLLSFQYESGYPVMDTWCCTAILPMNCFSDGNLNCSLHM